MIERHTVVVGVLACLLLPRVACAEFSVIFYIGKSLTAASPLRLKKQDADLTFQEVRWEDRSFEAPIFYGYRISYWLDRDSPWGVSVDFTHAKAIMQENETTWVAGSRDGRPVAARERISETIEHFELSHGLNMITFNGLYRWFPTGTRDESGWGRLQPYAGLGAGFSVPHVEANVGDVHTGRYQLGAGPVINGLGGLNYDVAHALSGILEYKLSYADVHGELDNGGFIEAATYTQQFISGASGNFNAW